MSQANQTNTCNQMIAALFSGKNTIKGNVHRGAIHLKYLLHDHRDQNSFSHSLFKERCKYINDQVNVFFSKNDISNNGYDHLSHGGQSVVLDCNNGYVLKVRRGDAYEVPFSPSISQPEIVQNSPDLDVSFGIFKKAEPIEADNFSRQALKYKLAFEGIYLMDSNKYNFGLEEKKNGKKALVVIDADATKKMDSSLDFFRLGRDIFKPIYAKMPFLHTHWRRFKKTALDILEPHKKTKKKVFAHNVIEVD